LLPFFLFPKYVLILSSLVTIVLHPDRWIPFQSPTAVLVLYALLQSEHPLSTLPALALRSKPSSESSSTTSSPPASSWLQVPRRPCHPWSKQLWEPATCLLLLPLSDTLLEKSLDTISSDSPTGISIFITGYSTRTEVPVLKGRHADTSWQSLYCCLSCRIDTRTRPIVYYISISCDRVKIIYKNK
jgi:hypothetical protein